jgi:autotransporter-associated beta strand protein
MCRDLTVPDRRLRSSLRASARVVAGALILFAVAGSPFSAHAATTTTWSGAVSGSWQTASNWSGDAVPGSSSYAVLGDPSASGAALGTLGGSGSAEGIQFTSVNGITLDSIPNLFVLTLGNSGISVISPSSTNTINDSISLTNNNETWTNNSTGRLVIAGRVAFTSTSSKTLTIGGTGNIYLEGGLTGTGALTSNSTGQVIISGSTNYSDVTTVSSGTLQFIGSPSMNNTITNNGVLVFSPSASVTDSKNISGGGSLVVNGASVLQLGTSETYTGPTLIAGGTLQIGTYNGTGSAAIVTSPNVVDNGALFFGKKVAQDYPNPISGSGVVGLLGAGVLTLDSTNNTYTGGTILSQGTLQLRANNNLPSAGALTLGGTGNATFDLAGYSQQVGSLAVAAGALSPGNQVIGNSSIQFNSTLTVTGNSTFAGTIQDTLGNGTQQLGLTVNGAQVTLAGVNTYSGPTNVVSGGLVLGSPSALSTSTNVFLGGPGTSGTLDLGGNSVALASLAAAPGSNAASQIVGNSSTTSDAVLALSGTTSFAGSIQDSLGNGGHKTGVTISAGNVTLSGSNSYSGPTNVNGGVLSINGPQTGSGDYNVGPAATLLINGSQSGGGTLSIASGGTLGGGGSIAAAINLPSGATLAAGGLAGNAGTLSLSSLSLSGGNVQLGLSGNPASGNGLVNVNGLLSLSGTTTINVVTLGTSLTTGSYPLFTFGSLSGIVSSALSLAAGATNSRQSASFTSTSNANGGEIFLNVVGNPHTLVWTGITNSTWDTIPGNLNWINSQNSADYFANGDNVTFNDSSGSPAVVSIPGLVLPGSVTVNANTYNVAFGGTGSIGGNTGLTKTGTGTLTISNTNSYTDPTAIQAGTVVVGTSNALSPASGLVLGSAASNGTLDLAGNNQQLAGLATDPAAIAANQVIGNSSNVADSTLTFSGVSPSTFGGTIQDSLGGGTQVVALDVAAGQLTLTGVNTYSGGTTINGGTLQLGSANGIPSGPSTPNIAINGTLDLNGFGLVLTSISGSGTVVNNAANGQTATLTVGTADTSATFAGVVQDGSGPTALDKTGSGVLVLTGSNTYSGLTTISGGTLQIGNGGINGSVASNIVNNATLLVNNGGIFAYPGSISGSGTLLAAGPGRLVLGSTSSYTGGTVITGGTLALGVTNALPVGTTVTLGGASSSVLDLAGNSQQVTALVDANPTTEAIVNSSLTASGTLTITGNTTFAGVITDKGPSFGTVALNIAGGNVQLSGANTYSGGTTIGSGGTLQINDGGSTGSTAAGNVITDNGLLIFNHSNSITPGVILQGAGTLVQAGIGTLVLNKAETFSGTAIIFAGTLQLGTNGTTVTFPAASIVNNSVLNIDRGGTLDFTAPISGPGSLAITGGGTIILNGSNTFTGPINITNSSAVLQISDGSTAGSIANNNISINCQLNFDRPDYYVYSGSLSGSGSIYQNGAGTLDLQGDSSELNAALVVVNSGTLVVSGSGNLNVPGTLRGTAGGAIVLTDNAVVTAGKLVAKGPNGLTISGNASVNVANDNFQIGLGSGDTDTGTAISATQNGGSVNLSGSGTFIVGSYFAAQSSSTGTYTQNAGSVTLAPGSFLQFANTGGQGIYNLNGGLLSLPGVTLGSGSGSLVLNGGTLQAAAGASAAFIDPGVATSIGPAGATIDNGGNAITLSGNISGAFSTSSLTLLGDGQLILSGSNSYGGGTIVNAGTLDAASAGALPEGTSLAVGAGAAQLFGSSPLAGPLVVSFASPAGAAVEAVPEPGTLGLVLAALVSAAGAYAFRMGRRL